MAAQAGFLSYLVGNSRRHILSCRGSIILLHVNMYVFLTSCRYRMWCCWYHWRNYDPFKCTLADSIFVVESVASFVFMLHYELENRDRVYRFYQSISTHFIFHSVFQLRHVLLVAEIGLTYALISSYQRTSVLLTGAFSRRSSFLTSAVQCGTPRQIHLVHGFGREGPNVRY